MKSIHDVLFDLSFADVFIFSEFVWRGLICARVQAQLRFQKGISWDSSCKEDTNLIPKRKILGDPKLAMVFVERMRLNALPNNLKTF